MAGVAFEEIVRNLLVYLKGQIPSMNSKNKKEEIVRQLQSISFTLRTTIVQLEGAAFKDPKGSNEYQKVKEELDSLKATNNRLEESLFLEMNKTKTLTNQLRALENEDQEREEKARHLLDKYNQAKLEIEKLMAEKQSLSTNSGQNPINDEQITSLKDKIESLENELEQSNTKLRDLKQALQEKEIELSKSQKSLLEVIKLNKSEVAKLTDELSNNPSKEIYQNNMAAAEAKIAFLTETVKKLQTQTTNISSGKIEQLQQKKQELEQRVIDLETALKRTINRYEAASSNNSLTFKPEDSIFLFDTLFTTMQRLQRSPENKDIFQKTKESIQLLERNNAVNKIKSLGQIYDSKLHTAIKSFKCDFLSDGMIIFEKHPGFVSGTHVIRKAVVYVNKFNFVCTECGYQCRNRDLFCPKCGLELAAPDGTPKKDIEPIPTTVEFNLPLIDTLIQQHELSAANALLALVARLHPDNTEIVKRQQNLLLLTDSQQIRQFENSVM